MNQDLETITPKSRAEWRKWLEVNHDKKQSVWLIYYKKNSGVPTLSYGDAVDEALCFGWIDSRMKPIDDEKYMQFFSRRKEKSVWSKVNKQKIAHLLKEGLMREAALKSIETAKENGSWQILDEVEELIIPNDLLQGFRKSTGTEAYFLSLSRSDKRNILQWLVLAKRPETRARRIEEIVTQAKQKQKPKQFRGRKKL